MNNLTPEQKDYFESILAVFEEGVKEVQQLRKKFDNHVEDYRLERKSSEAFREDMKQLSIAVKGIPEIKVKGLVHHVSEAIEDIKVLQTDKKILIALVVGLGLASGLLGSHADVILKFLGHG